MYSQGEIIAARLPLGIEHFGVASGYGTVVSASMRTGMVIEESIEIFAGGYSIISKGYPSALNPNVVMARARNSVGEKWDLLTNNCQHFATWCHENKHSPQLQWVAGGVLAVVALVCIFKLK